MGTDTCSSRTPKIGAPDSDAKENVYTRLTTESPLNAGNSTRILRVKVKPNARISVLEGPDSSGIWNARLKSPPIDGRANQELIRLVAARFGCRQTRISIKHGATGRIKLVRIADA